MKNSVRSLLGAATIVVLGLTACGGDDEDDAADTSTPTSMSMSTEAPGTSAAPGTTAAPATTAAPDTTAAPGTDAPGTDAPGTTAGGSTPASGEFPMEVTVDITDFTFNPADIQVAVGGTVTFVNNDEAAHTATATGAFDTGNIAAGESATITLDEAGTFDYICAYHPFMTGSITVG